MSSPTSSSAPSQPWAAQRAIADCGKPWTAEASYEAVKADLISLRLIVPGRGRGGSVAFADGSGVESSGDGQAASRTLNLSRYGDAAEARRQSEHLAQVDPSHWSEQLPDWNDWTA